jgi:hypothetical protein
MEFNSKTKRHGSTSATARSFKKIMSKSNVGVLHIIIMELYGCILMTKQITKHKNKEVLGF